MKKQLGVALTKCYFCGRDDRVLINAKLAPSCASFVEDMHGKVIDMEPCPQCAALMTQGVILITIDTAKSEPGWNEQPLPNPFRTGGFFVVKDEAISRIVPPALSAWALKHRFMFIEHEAADVLGLFAVPEKEEE